MITDEPIFNDAQDVLVSINCLITIEWMVALQNTQFKLNMQIVDLLCAVTIDSLKKWFCFHLLYLQLS
uniref:Uncharacterized protein n=1 Tax=Arundo donax TaxID=35708 RepID=A0A0A9G662_ARUDO